MALTLKDRVLETTTTTGTGSISLGGTQTGYQAFSVIGDGNTTYYTIQGVDSNGNPTGEWEVGLGTYTVAGNTLSRDVVYDSSNGGAKVVFSAGTKQVFCDLPAEQVGGAGGVTSVTGTAPVVSSGGTTPAISMAKATTSVDGYLSSTDWNTFNNKGQVNAITSTDGSVSVTGTSTVDLSVAIAASTTNVIVQVRNTTGATLTKGTVVYISGATGQIPTVSKALATSDATSAQSLGMMTADLANNSNGYVTIIGLINDIDTSAFTDGAQLYLSSTTAGAVTATKQYAPAHLVYVGVVEYAHAVHGKIFVKVQNGYELDELHNVSAQTPSNGQTIIYNATTGLWNAANLTAGTGMSVTNGAGSITLTNTAPDQTTVLTPVAPITVTGTYPNFTLGITQAGTASNGYLSSTDWNTFNGKGSGTVTSVGGTGTVSGISLSGTVTSSGSLTLGGALDLSSPPAIGLTTPNTIQATTFDATASTSASANQGAYAYGTLGYSDTNVIASFQSSVNSYNQVVLQNTNAGAAASTNFNVSNNAGTATTNYGEFGINSSTFTGSGAFAGAGAVYLASASTDLAIGTYGANAIHFVVNSGATDAATISSAGLLTANSFASSSAAITGGSVNSTPIGATTASTGAFTTLSASSTVSGTGFSTYLASPPAIGGTTAAAGSFTTLSASSTVSGTGFSTYLASPPAIGGTTPAAITGTTITANTAFSGPHNGTVGATTPNTGAFTTLTASGAVTLSPASAAVAISPTGTGTVAISPAGALTVNPTAASTINNCSIGATTASSGSFTSLTATSRAGVLATAARTAGSVLGVTGSLTLTTAGTTLASQTAAAGAVWRIRAYGTYAAISSANARTFTMACFWGTTQLTSITAPAAVLVSVAQTTNWNVEFEIATTSTTAAWVTGQLNQNTGVATGVALLTTTATAASTVVTAGAQTLDLRVGQTGTATTDTINVHQVIIERIA